MSSQRDAGLAALQSSDFAVAIPLLEDACSISSEDYDAHLYLGAAYGEAGRQMDAISAITKCVEIQPSNAQARYNLGVAMERAGYEDQAKLAFEQALTLQPEYPQAQEALQRLSNSTSAIQAAPLPIPQTATFQPPNAVLAEQTSALPPQTQATYSPRQPVPLYGSPQQTQNYGSPQAQPPIALSQPTGGVPYGIQQQEPSARLSANIVSEPYVDKRDLRQAGRNMFQVLFSPIKFYDSQYGREGMKAAEAVLLLGCLLYGALSLVAAALQPYNSPYVALFMLILMVGVYTICAIVSGVWHHIGKIFGNRTPYSVSFRVCAFSFSPLFLQTFLLAIIAGVAVYFYGSADLDFAVTHGSVFNPTLISNAIGPSMQGIVAIVWFVTFTWTFALSWIGIQKSQKISTGGAFAAVVVSLAVLGALYVTAFAALLLYIYLSHKS